MTDQRTHLSDVPADWRAASTALAEATRELVEAVALTGAGTRALALARAEVEELTARLRRTSRPHALRPGPDDLAALRGAASATIVVRPGNPAAVPLAIRVHAETAEATWTAGPVHEGPPGSLHGGLSASLLDSVLGTLVQVRGEPAVTGTLSVRYRRRVPLGVPLTISGALGERTGRRLPVTGRIEAEGEVCVEAEALFVALADR